jgi:electron transfer flavoprotein alpha subunit
MTKGALILNDIWVFAEHNNRPLESITWEMLTEGRKLAAKLHEQLCACLIGAQTEGYIGSLSHYGARKVYLVENEGFPAYSVDGYAHILKELVVKYKPSIIMIGATPVGSELAARIAAKLRLPCITEVKKVSFSDRKLSIAKSGFNDKLYMNFDFSPKKTVIVTILPGDMDRDEDQEHTAPEIIREKIAAPLDKMHTINKHFIKGDPRKIDLEEAQAVIAVGKGVGTEAFALLEQLANILGASIGATRPLIDDGIVPHERQIGITGKSIAPKVLIACGISGAREFTGGIENAKLTIAVNTDPKARIFKAADMSVLGDVNEVIPALIEKLTKKRRLRMSG